MQFPQTNPPMPPMMPLVREKRKYGALAALVLSFFSGELYRDVATRWRGIGFWYLVLLMLLTSIPEGIAAHIGFRDFVKTDVVGLIETCPTITFDSKHEISIPQPEGNYIWKDPKTNKVIMYIDITGKFDLPEGANAPVKLSKTQLIVRKSALETQTYKLSELPLSPFTFDKNVLRNWVDIGAHYVGVAVFAFGFVFGVIGHLIQIVIYGLFGLIFCSMFSAKLDYAALMRLSAVAITPAMILATIVECTKIPNPTGDWLYFGVEMVALLLAVKANARGNANLPAGFPMSSYAPGYGGTPGGYAQQPGGFAAPPQQYPPVPPPQRG